MSSSAEGNRKQLLKKKWKEQGLFINDSRSPPQRVLDCARDTQSGTVVIPARLLSALNLELLTMGDAEEDEFDFSYRNIREMPSRLEN